MPDKSNEVPDESDKVPNDSEIIDLVLEAEQRVLLSSFAMRHTARQKAFLHQAF